MGARRLVLAVLVSMCGLSLVLVGAPGSAAAASQFGSLGSASGQLQLPVGVAIDGIGDVYVGDEANKRVDKFDGSGSFSLAWGWGVEGGEELQTCTTACEIGKSSGVAGGFDSPWGVAVDDNEPLTNPSYGDVYVLDQSNARVEKYDSSGKFLLMFGGDVNERTGGDVCVASEACKEGSASTGTADGEFSGWFSIGSFIAVGPGGDVYVGDMGRVEVFEPSGVWKENISLASLSGTARPTALAVDSSGNVFVKDEGVSGVHEFEPGGAEKAFQLDAGSEPVTALAVDPSGDVFVGDSTGGFHVLEYDSAGHELASFASKTVVGANEGLAFSEAAKALYASALLDEESVFIQSSIWVLPVPPPGPVVETESATPGLRGTATLEALLNPEGNGTTYHFEYVDDAQYQSTGFAAATSTASVSIGSGSFEDQSVEAQLTGLVPGATYHYRLVAEDSLGNTTTGAPQGVTTIPPADIEGPWVVNAAGTSVTLNAQVNPLGASTTYRWEYGTTTSYGHVFSGSAGEGMGFLPMSYHAQELEPDTTYHYRLVTTSEVGTVQSADHTFTTQLASDELTLPDGRAWELVSPANKKGALIEPQSLQEAASDGSAVAYQAVGPNVGENPAGNVGEESDDIARRSPGGGWVSEDISVPRQQTTDGFRMFDLESNKSIYRAFSQNLSSTVLEPSEFGTPTLSPEATERTLYLRDDAHGTFLPLVTPANVPPGTKFGGYVGSNGGPEPTDEFRMEFSIATPDLSHIVLSSVFALTPEAFTVLSADPKCAYGGVGLDFCPQLKNFYEWSGGRLQLVNILPNGEPTHELPIPEIPLTHGVGADGGSGIPGRDISDNGRWIAWNDGSPYSEESDGYDGLYVRDMIEKKTVRIGGSDPIFQMISGDGSKVFFRERGELYVFDTATDTQTDLTANHGSGEYNAGVREAVIGASEDGSSLYFVATGILADGGVSGEDNLYVADDEGSGWKTEYVATLSSQDEADWARPSDDTSLVSRVSPNGRYLTFMSDRSLTGYDNLDALSGQADEEVFLYDADTGRITCVSCDPSGARPVGMYDEPGSSQGPPLGDRGQMWSRRWLAANIPTPKNATQQSPRSLFDDGRVFFDSSDALVPQDTNGLEDVYEYEPPGVGSCTSASSTFSERSGGCVDLVSSGQSAEEAAFFGASENGDDAFFFDDSKLVSEDYDTSYDIYDAHACSAALPCRPEPVSAPPCTSGDSCKAAPSPQPEVFGPAPSATFSGTGNVSNLPSKPAVGTKSLTRAQKLARALRACRKQKGKQKRESCERQARKRYGLKQSRKANATRKGDR